jgi:hypothetical protein
LPADVNVFALDWDENANGPTNLNVQFMQSVFGAQTKSVREFEVNPMWSQQTLACERNDRLGFCIDGFSWSNA